MQHENQTCQPLRFDRRQQDRVERRGVSGVIGFAACCLQADDIRQIVDVARRLEGFDEIGEIIAIGQQQR